MTQERTHRSPRAALKSEPIAQSHENATAQADTEPDRRRREELASLIPLWPNEYADLSIAGRHRVIAILARALRGERKRARSGHWTYNVARHAALIRTYRSERESLNALLRRKAHIRCRAHQRNAQKKRPPGGGRTAF